MPAFATFALATTLSAFTTPPVEMAVGPTAARARAWEQAAAGLDTQAIARALGREGQLIGDVYRVSLPRSDLAVTVRGVTVRPGLALGSWMAFRPAGGAVVAHGDLVLLASEVNPVISRLLAGGLRVTALHNHLIGESPQVLYLHFWGRGEAEALARSLAEALRATRTPVAAPPAAAADPRLPADRLQRALGLSGTVRDGVLSIAVPRPERITMEEVELPPAMGMATVFNFQATADGRVAATGDFVLRAEETAPVVAALRAADIDVTALHNHLLHGDPDLYFLHFWAHDTPEHVAEGLRRALDHVRR